MVGDHDIQSSRASEIDLGDGRDPAVDRDQQPDPTRCETVHRMGREAIAIVEAAG
jgi:hypothetical protein